MATLLHTHTHSHTHTHMHTHTHTFTHTYTHTMKRIIRRAPFKELLNPCPSFLWLYWVFWLFLTVVQVKTGFADEEEHQRWHSHFSEHALFIYI